MKVILRRMYYLGISTYSW